MGKKFYATHSDKGQAKVLANGLAASRRGAKCYTPARDSSCRQNEDGDWVCMAKSHNQPGSCGGRERLTNSMRARIDRERARDCWGKHCEHKGKAKPNLTKFEEYSDASETDYNEAYALLESGVEIRPEAISRLTFDLSSIKDGQDIPSMLKAAAPDLMVVLNHHKEIENSGSKLDKPLEKLYSSVLLSDECTVVYGSCDGCNENENAAWVEYYCSASGSSEPDYKSCVTC